MNAGFTPGPWQHQAFPTEQGVVFDISITEPGGVDVAYTYSHEGNARLIAAAPELLAACIEMCNHYSGSLDYQPAYVVMARAAIAKATGGTT